MRIDIDQELCISAGHCTMAAPEVFDQDQDTGTVELHTDRPPAAQEQNTRDAVALCPVAAISIAEH